MSYEEAKKIAKKHEDELLAKENVVGVEPGKKEVGDEERDEYAVRVLVKTKVDEEDLDERDIIPAEIEGIVTDVDDQEGPINLLKTRKDKWRPSPLSPSCGHPDVTAGTLGSLVKKNGEFYVLSNNHVLADMNKAEIGDPTLQPGSYDGGKVEEDQLTELADYVEVPINENSKCSVASGVAGVLNKISKALNRKSRFKTYIKKKAATVDCAISGPVKLGKDVYSFVLGKRKNDKYERLKIRGSKRFEVGEKAWTSGRTLGYRDYETTGAEVKSLDATIMVYWGGTVKKWKHQVHVKSDKDKPKFSAGGMSGSAMNSMKDMKQGALLFAGNRKGNHTYGNRIGLVEEKLGIKVVDMKDIA